MVEHVFVSPPPEPTVLHADLDAFFASVEQRDDPSLRGRPVIVGGGVVMAASYEARARGVRGAMGGAQARRLCPEAVVVRPRWEAYVEASRAVFRVFERTTPVVEAISIDEAFLDVRGMERIAGSSRRIAEGLRRDVREQVGLPITVGVARTKTLAKLASVFAKPDGLLVVPIADELAFLHPLPVEMLWGVGPVTAERLRACGIATVGQIARMGEDALVPLLGRSAGRHLHAVASNRDPRPVRRRRGRRTFGAQSAIGRGPHAPERLDTTLVALADRVTRRMRAAGATGRTVVLRLRFDDFSRATRSCTLVEPTASSRAVLGAVRGLLAAAEPEVGRRGCTLLGVAVSNLTEGDAWQLALPIDAAGADAVDAAMDLVRDRFGPAAVTRASLAGRDPGLAAFLPPRRGRRSPPSDALPSRP
ncbi:MAG: polymerase [Miltoncostaeaceae bacterium]|nr:polymerase [Miltoncostaeaceae bacterium]